MRQFNKVPGDADTAGPGTTFLDFLIYFLFGGKLLFNFVLVSALQGYESVIIIHISV